MVLSKLRITLTGYECSENTLSPSQSSLCSLSVFFFFFFFRFSIGASPDVEVVDQKMVPTTIMETIVNVQVLWLLYLVPLLSRMQPQRSVGVCSSGTYSS